MKSTTIPLAVESVRSPLDAAARVPLTRREWLKGSGVLFGTLALSSTLAMFTPSRTWALELQQFGTREAKVLLAFVRQLYPHPTLDDAVYALVIKDLETKASKDPALRQSLADGVRQLDARAQGDWTRRAAADQAHDVADLAGTPFFETVRSTAIVSLYSNPLAYRHFGYGAEQGDGGYLYQGFNKLVWLPDPPAEDSGPIPSDS
ncbi:tat (twin-arginine translocation) pathway signal sequence [Burkholderia pyrrocinia]|uniref:tat (twin-arginine translocation) pathway signal sequence n=1 Tax=Burkholderia pyrrocinia TaxID=60550 RepID=UPI0015761BA9|nr:tat (twin-arginine translocation) pathway signal sequence [Burkholderia pyrrocinia]NTX25713.1 tat (twin-arginine translocation) pathway signal sequence [Burkholderia pyrrocinia]